MQNNNKEERTQRVENVVVDENGDNYPEQINRHLKQLVEDQLHGLKREWDDQQVSLHEQLLNLKVNSF